MSAHRISFAQTYNSSVCLSSPDFVGNVVATRIPAAPGRTVGCFINQ
jgi:hypothetical protein